MGNINKNHVASPWILIKFYGLNGLKLIDREKVSVEKLLPISLDFAKQRSGSYVSDFKYISLNKDFN